MSGGGVPSLVDAIARARKLGATVTNPKATGEVLVVFADGKRERVRINNRRKDSTPQLTAALRRREA